MLRRSKIIIAAATVGLLAMAPLAFAGGTDPVADSVAVVDQENEQESEQGNGVLNGNNVGSGNAVQVANNNVNVGNNALGAVAPIGSDVDQDATTTQRNGDASNEATAIGQKTEQSASNSNSARKNSGKAGKNISIVDQENEQESEQGNGVLNGNNVGSGNAVQVANNNVNVGNNALGAVAPIGSDVDQDATTTQRNGDASNEATAIGQKTEQSASNSND